MAPSPPTSSEPPTMKVLVVVPTYHEVENIDELMRQVAAEAPELDVLFVDDHSTDGTVELIEAWQAQRPGRLHLLQRASKLGLGTAYVAGFRWALERDYAAVIEMDADLSHDPAVLPRLVELLGRYDVVVGSRYVRGGGTRNWNFFRRMISRGGGLYARIILGLGVNDPTGGFNAWNRRVLEAIGLDTIRSDGYSFQIELKYRAVRAGFSLHETPILFEDRRAGQSKMSSDIVVEAMRRVLTMRMEGR